MLKKFVKNRDVHAYLDSNKSSCTSLPMLPTLQGQRRNRARHAEEEYGGMSSPSIVVNIPGVVRSTANGTQSLSQASALDEPVYETIDLRAKLAQSQDKFSIPLKTIHKSRNRNTRISYTMEEQPTQPNIIVMSQTRSN